MINEIIHVWIVTSAWRINGRLESFQTNQVNKRRKEKEKEK